MRREINIKVNDGRIKGTIYDPAMVNAQILAVIKGKDGEGTGGGMNGEFTAVTFNTGTNTLPIGAIESDKVKWTITNGLTNNVISFGAGTVGARKSLWIHETSGSFKLFNRELGLDGIFQILTSQPSIDYSENTYSDHLFECYCIAANQWIFAEVGLPDTITTLPAAVSDLETGKVDKAEGYRLVSDTEIAKIHSQNTDQYLDFGGPNEIEVYLIKYAADYAHSAGTDSYLEYGQPNQVSGAELRGIVDFANIATPPTAYQIPVVQDITGVKSLKYSADFVFENGCLKVKGAGNTTGKTLSIFNLAGTENVTVLDSGLTGIGTNDPKSYLHVKGTYKANYGNLVIDTNGAGYGWISFFSGSTRLGWFGHNGPQGMQLASGTGIPLGFSVNNDDANPALFIKSDKKIGISTNTPAKSLEVSHATGDCFRLSYDKSTTFKADFTLDAYGKLTIAAAGGHEFTGDVNLTGVLKIDGVQVVGNQQPQISLIATDFDDFTLLSEATNACNDLNNKVDEIITAMRNHGLIAT